MANLLVYVAPNHLDDMLGAGVREPGRRVPILRAKLPPQIERLDALSTLFLVTVHRVRARVVASLEHAHGQGPVLGNATIHDLDITGLLVRLGCPKVWHVSEWAATPRIVPPEDSQLLRYHLGLPLEVDETGEVPRLPPETRSTLREHERPRSNHPVSPMTAPKRPELTRSPRRTGSHSAVRITPGEELRAAVYASPASDAARRDYAAFLQEIGDERGELIALQLGRVERGETVSDRERELLARVGAECAEPLRSFFASFELRGGFVYGARMERGVTVPEDMREHPAWATIEDLATTDDALLATAPLTSLRRVRIDQATFERIGTSDGLVSLDTLLPYPEPGTRGIALEPVEPVRWLDVIDGGAFVTHSLCVDASRLATRVPQFMQSRLVRRLSHLDAWIDPPTAPTWRQLFDASDLPLLTLRFAAHGIEPVVAFERRDGVHRMVVELRATVSAEIANDLAALIAGLGKGVTELELVDTSLAPFPAQQPELVRALGTAFSMIVLHRAESLALV